MAIERVKPIPRASASLSLTNVVQREELGTPAQVVDYFAESFFVIPLDDATLEEMGEFLSSELGSDDVLGSLSFAEEPLRKLLHKMLSLPEYQLG